MSIAVGEKLPAGTLMEMTASGPGKVAVDDVFSGKKVALFAVPGAFTPTCSAKHLPGYVEQAADIKAKGVDEIVCLSVNDPFVMAAWGKNGGADGKVRMMADPDGAFTKSLGFDFDASGAGLGTRSRRYSMVVENGVVKHLNLEEAPGAFAVSDAGTLISQL
ncbi:peroxiredoxin [Oceanibacterium hippocampi]|uniref:Glutathione-dependent peroxiredoxin n=1 Tax=Oceanibacterium hippocampi TaxID=745714 RepID=A0A1Y5S623_9PROT|nr:peroxiredoxin [Oceanibacterium hippocampi]SLN33384.1 Putative peroxiredoxin [Oceanibacterium hippocampi]